MRSVRHLMVLVAVLAIALLVSGCSGGTAATGELTPDERPVPDGMPVMYEFYTLS